MLVTFLEENPEGASFCAHRDNVSQPWASDQKCKLVITSDAVACNCTVLGEVTVVTIPEDIQSSDEISSKEGNKVGIMFQ